MEQFPPLIFWWLRASETFRKDSEMEEEVKEEGRESDR
jgi:hypothetical protein